VKTDPLPAGVPIFNRRCVRPLYCGLALSPAVNSLRTSIKFLFAPAIGPSGDFLALINTFKSVKTQLIDIKKLEFAEITTYNRNEIPDLKIQDFSGLILF
jgi:hypothetical protein